MVFVSIFQIVLALVWLLIVCFVVILALRLYEESSKKVGLPRLEENNLLFYLRWLFHVYRSDAVYKNVALLRLISFLALTYKETGLIHCNILFCNLVILSKATTAQPLLQSASNIDKPMFYYFFEETLGSSLFLRKGDKWRGRRKLLSPAFHLKILENFTQTMEKQSQLLVEEFTCLGENDRIDVVPFINRCILKTLCETAMGVPGELLESDIEVIHKLVATGMIAAEGRHYAIWKWPNFIFRLTQEGRNVRRTVDVFNEITNKIIQERISQAKTEESETFSSRKQTGKPLAFLDLLLRSISDGSDLTLDDVRDEIILFLCAGLDTTSLALIWTLHLIGKHPDVQTRLQEEVDNVIGDDKDKLLSKNDLFDLKYTECVIKEALRLYPVGPLIARKATEDIVIGNYKIPKGFICVVSIQDIHMDPDTFPRPEKFDPERFSPENSLGRHPYAFIPFSAGPRNCIGQKFAMMQVKIVLARLMHKFTIHSLDQHVGMKYMNTLHPDGPVRLQVKKR